MASITKKYEEFTAKSGTKMYIELRWDKHTNATLWYYGKVVGNMLYELNRYHMGRLSKPNKKKLIEMY
jgi:hypothetical protein